MHLPFLSSLPHFSLLYPISVSLLPAVTCFFWLVNYFPSCYWLVVVWVTYKLELLLFVSKVPNYVSLLVDFSEASCAVSCTLQRPWVTLTSYTHCVSEAFCLDLVQLSLVRSVAKTYQSSFFNLNERNLLFYFCYDFLRFCYSIEHFCCISSIFSALVIRLSILATCSVGNFHLLGPFSAEASVALSALIRIASLPVSSCVVWMLTKMINFCFLMTIVSFSYCDLLVLT